MKLCKIMLPQPLINLNDIIHCTPTYLVLDAAVVAGGGVGRRLLSLLTRRPRVVDDGGPLTLCPAIGLESLGNTSQF